MAPALLWLALQSPIASVAVRGNVLVPAASILHHAGLDEHPAEGELPAAFQRLWETGLFEDVRFETESAAEGRRLIIRVQEKPVLRDTRLTGERVEEAGLRDSLRRAGFALEARPPMGGDDARKIAAAAGRALGPEYEVRARLEPASEVQVDLILEVTRRLWPRVASIHFEGNRLLNHDDLFAVMQLRPSGLLTRLSRRDRYDSEVLEDDLERLRRLYGRRGFARASVGPAAIDRVSGGESISIAIPIVEGDRYRFGRLEVEPGSLLALSDARSYLPESGAAYDVTILESAADRLKDYCLSHGYPTVRVDREEIVVPNSTSVDVTLRVVEGPFLRTGFINFRGHLRHRDSDLRQFLDLLESEPFDPRRIDDSVRALMRSGDFVGVTPDVDLEAGPGRAEVGLRVEEKKAFEYIAGGGLNGVEGATGNGELLARGLLGRFETLRLELDLGNRFQNLAFGYHDLSTLGRRLFLAADFRRSLLDYPDETSEDTIDLALRAGGPSGSARQFLAALRFADFTLGSSIEDEVLFLTPFLGMRFATYRASIALFHQVADRPVFSSRGHRVALGYELVAGDVELQRLSLEGAHLFPLDAGGRHVLGVSGRAAALLSFGETSESGIPRFERLFLGSENDLRGFPIRGVGPRQGAYNVGGDRLAFGSVEYRFSVFPRLRAVGFLDLGNAFATDFEETDGKGLRYDAGGEAQILVPLANLPLRIGYGRNLDPLPDEPRGRFFVSFDIRF
jgi:outer membrane protein insertion porin family